MTRPKSALHRSSSHDGVPGMFELSDADLAQIERTLDQIGDVLDTERPVIAFCALADALLIVAADIELQTGVPLSEVIEALFTIMVRHRDYQGDTT